MNIFCTFKNVTLHEIKFILESVDHIFTMSMAYHWYFVYQKPFVSSFPSLRDIIVMFTLFMIMFI